MTMKTKCFCSSIEKTQRGICENNVDNNDDDGHDDRSWMVAKEWRNAIIEETQK